MAKLLDYHAPRIKKGISNPERFLRYSYESILGRIKLQYNRGYQAPSDGKLIHENWDVLAVLDACRYDCLAKLDPYKQRCQKRISQAPNTRLWFRENFIKVPENVLSNIVYVSANPMASSNHFDVGCFHHFEEVFEYGWDSKHNSVHPDIVMRNALRLQERYPNKRLIVHFIQPHGPLVGSERPELSENQFAALRQGSVTLERVKQAYRQCLQYVLDEGIDPLIKYTSGKIVVTSDHGEAFGEYGIYAHPPWANSKPLLEVPWIELTGDKEPLPAEMLGNTDAEGDGLGLTVEEKLQHLGYKYD